jgi:AhpD family alkylhydroperoxidase
MVGARKSLFRSWPEGYHALQAMHVIVADCGLGPELLELVRLRASQINGCAYCVDRHFKDARAAGETEQRLYSLSVWRETTFYSERERAALGLTEAVTHVSDNEGLARAVDDAAKSFGPDELTRLLYAVIEINAWNRLAITTGSPEPGSYDRNT